MPVHSSPYGDDYGMEPPVPVLMQPKEAADKCWTPSAPPGALNDQALRSHFIPPKEDDQANQGAAVILGKKTIKELATLTQVEHRARHMAHSGLDQCSLDQHSDRWNKVDAQTTKELPADDDQEPFKQIVATKLGKECSFNLRKTQDDGVFTVTAEATKRRVSKNIQGSVGGALLIDTLQRTLKMGGSDGAGGTRTNCM